MKGINRFNFNAVDKKHKIRAGIMKCFSFLPDRAYLKFVFRIRTGKKLDLDNPVTFCDKMNWLKLNDKHEEYTQLVDKLAVRDHVGKILGDGYFFPLIGSWKTFDEIDFDKLPDKFVLKCNHDSGSVKIIDDKTKLTQKDLAELKEHFDRHLNRNPFYSGREYPYKNVESRIIAEQFMESADGKGINDYKFFCFNGEPKIMFVATDRRVDCKFDFYDMDFNHLDIKNIHPNSSDKIEKPALFEEMKSAAAKLSQGIKFVRIDLYEISGKIYFGEYTFFHAGGFWPLKPDKWEKELGDWINLN